LAYDKYGSDFNSINSIVVGGKEPVNPPDGFDITSVFIGPRGPELFDSIFSTVSCESLAGEP
jgi:hypothetical protein